MKIALSVLAVVVAASGLTGCYSNQTPELRGMAMTPAEFQKNRKVSMNQNVRMFNDELSRILLLDSPSTLTPFPVVNTSGMPR